MKLYNRTLSRRDLEARVGRIEQVAGIRRMKLLEGPEDGTEIIQVRTGAGLAYQVLPSRCLDISLATIGDVPISWQSGNGDVHPAYYDPRGLEWLRTAAGGLLMTCGFTQAGAPNVDNEQELGLHGRAHHTPASQVAAQGRWNGDEYTMTVSGTVEETVIFGEHIRLIREIRSVLGSNTIHILDHYENFGFQPAPLMLLYHFNFGFPLLMRETTFSFPSRHVKPREDDTPMKGYDGWQSPDPGHTERVYIHSDLESDEAGWAHASVRNPHFPRGFGSGHQPVTVTLSWDTTTLPGLVQWRMPGAGAHVLGIEPTNCNVRGRAASRADGSLHMLEPGETHKCSLRLNVQVAEA
jgi:hypothetical protein